MGNRATWFGQFVLDNKKQKLQVTFFIYPGPEMGKTTTTTKKTTWKLFPTPTPARV